MNEKINGKVKAKKFYNENSTVDSVLFFIVRTIVILVSFLFVFIIIALKHKTYVQLKLL